MIEHFVELPDAPKPVGIYSAAVKANGLLFCAGQIGLDPTTGKIVAGGVENEAKQVLKNLAAVLRGCGSSPQEILMTSIFLANITDGKVVNELYGQFLGLSQGGAAPARQTLAVKDLPMGALVEISVIAAVKNQ